MIRITAYYLFSLAVMTLYGGQVCPFIDTLTLLDWGKTLVVFFTILFVVRFWAEKQLVLSKPLVSQPRWQMIMEFWLFIAAALAIALYNHFVYVFPPIGSGGKVGVGMFTLGSFLAIDMTLHRERKVIREAQRTGQRFKPSHGFRSLTKKFTIFAVLVLSFVAVVIMLVISKDINWISMTGGDHITRTQMTITFEILFVISITLGLVLNLIYSYSKTLQLFFDNETEVLSQVNNGDLDGYVPVVSRDEFAQIAQSSTGRYWLERWMSNGDIRHVRSVLDELVARLGAELTREERYRQAFIEWDFAEALKIAREDGELTGREIVDLYPFTGDNSLDEALDSLVIDNDQKISNTPDNWIAYSHKGMALALKGQHAEAIELGKKGVSMMPLSRDAVTGASALEYLADIYMWSNRLDEAIETYQKVISVPCWTHPIDIMVDPYYDLLRSHPRYNSLLAAVSKTAS